MSRPSREVPAEAQRLFSAEAIRGFQNAFNAFSKDGNERIPVDFLGKLFRAVGYLPTRDEVEWMKEDLSDGDGLITFNDFLYFLYYHARSANPKRELFTTFRVFDHENTGKLPVDVARKILLSFKNPLSNLEIEELLKITKRDSEGLIDYEDFAEKLLNF
jgi:Ca2+-binding EF-hand superfamily protein